MNIDEIQYDIKHAMKSLHDLRAEAIKYKCPELLRVEAQVAIVQDGLSDLYELLEAKEQEREAEREALELRNQVEAWINQSWAITPAKPTKTITGDLWNG